MGGRFELVFWLTILAAIACPVSAHQVSSVSLVARIDSEKQTYLLDAAMQVVPSTDPTVNEEISPEEAAREFAEGYLNVLFDEQEVTPEIKVEIIEASDDQTPEELQRKEVVTTMTGEIPEGSKEFLLYLDPSCPMAVVLVTIKDDRPSRRMQVILAGEYSRAVDVRPLMEGDPFDAGQTSSPAGAPETSRSAVPVPKEAPDPVAAESEEREVERDSDFAKGWSAFFSASLIPLLLPASVFLLTLMRKPAFVQMAALLVGMSIGVFLAVVGILPAASWVASIAGGLGAVIAFEVLIHRELKWWRVMLVLISGFFAGWLVGRFAGRGASVEGIYDVLRCVVGAELALVSVSVVSAAILLFLSRFDWYPKSVVQPLAVLIGAVSLYSGVEMFF